MLEFLLKGTDSYSEPIIRFWGFLLFLFYGSLIINFYWNGDFNLTTGNLEARLPEINLILHTLIGGIFFFFPLNRRLMGFLSTFLTMIVFLCVIYIHRETTERLLLSLLFVSLVFVLPSLSILAQNSEEKRNLFEDI